MVEDIRFMKAQDFLQVAGSPKLIQDLDEKARSLEGYLFPAAYRVTRHTSAVQICKEMTDRFRRAWKELNAGNARVHSTVTLASLVEKEAAVPADRATIASVFQNRLDRNMTLHCNPTTLYPPLQ